MHVCSYFRDYVSIVFEFFPMVFFLMALFGYMDVFIVAKWLVVDASMSICAPSVLTSQYQLHATTPQPVLLIITMLVGCSWQLSHVFSNIMEGNSFSVLTLFVGRQEEHLACK